MDLLLSRQAPCHMWNDGFADRWEQFHCELGSKYFAELGYDGLYVASLLAQAESAPNRRGNYIRDLRTNEVVQPAEAAPHAYEVRARFSEEGALLVGWLAADAWRTLREGWTASFGTPTAG